MPSRLRQAVTDEGDVAAALSTAPVRPSPALNAAGPYPDEYSPTAPTRPGSVRGDRRPARLACAHGGLRWGEGARESFAHQQAVDDPAQ